jgi:hypothetical protein
MECVNTLEHRLTIVKDRSTTSSKKLDNFEAAVALHFAYYIFVMTHSSIRCTPAMAAGVEKSFLTVGDLVEAAQ